MTNKKKSTPGGAQFPEQEHYITSVDKAQLLFDAIGEGPKRAIRRPKNQRIDRALRKLISEANSTGDCIINDGNGYYRPGEDDDIAFEEYIAKERHRAHEILRKVSRMEKAFDRRYL